MNKKILFIATIASTLISFNRVLAITEAEEIRTQLRERGISLEEQNRLIRRLRQLPRNSDETPETPKVILHDKNQNRIGGDLKGRPKNIENARIFFGTDKSGEPCYQSIAKHLENNPDFGDIKLIIYHEASWFPFSSDSFEYIGTVSDENAREKLIAAMTEQESGILFRLKNGLFARAEKDGVWCPAQKNKNQEAFFVGRTHDTSTCNRYAEFTKENNFQTKKFEK